VLPASSRLELPAELIPGPEAEPAPDSMALRVLDRVGLLEDNGLAAEARFELERLTREADDTSRLNGIAVAFSRRGYTSRAWRLALRSGSPAMQRLVYPLPSQGDLADAAAAAGVDPLLAAAIMRQESGFDPAALSRADARGLMQVMPTLGAALARVEKVPEWRTELLHQPEINLRFGTRHLAEMLRRYDRLEHTLAAYNAGSRPTGKWLTLGGVARDPEVFIERIQYVETRDYVRRVLRNLSWYRTLHPSVP
jgi:soluble lytic murein transglycosylase